MTIYAATTVKVRKHIKEVRRKYYADPEKRKCTNERQRLRGKTEEYRKKARERYKNGGRERALVRSKAYQAIKLGKLVRPDTCLIANGFCKGRLEGHHQNYNKVYEIIWLCHYHHFELHRIRAGRNWLSNESAHVNEILPDWFLALTL